MEEEIVSKSQRKREMHALQDLGARVVELSIDQIEQLDLDEPLRDAVLEFKRLTKHEAKRRQLQYIGRLMREIDPAPIQAKIAGWQGESRAHTAYMHTLERWRERLLADDKALTELAAKYPAVDVQRLRTLIRNAQRETAAGKPPKSFREIYQELRGVIPEPGAPAGNTEASE